MKQSTYLALVCGLGVYTFVATNVGHRVSSAFFGWIARLLTGSGYDDLSVPPRGEWTTKNVLFSLAAGLATSTLVVCGLLVAAFWVSR